MNFKCGGCGRSSHANHRSGWVKLPAGWLAREDGIESLAVVACSDGCAMRLDEQSRTGVEDQDAVDAIQLEANRSIRDAEARGDHREVDRLLRDNETQARARIAEKDGNT